MTGVLLGLSVAALILWALSPLIRRELDSSLDAETVLTAEDEWERREFEREMREWVAKREAKRPALRLISGGRS